MKSPAKRCAMALLSLLWLAVSALTPFAGAEASPNRIYSTSDLEAIIEGIIDWKKVENGSTVDGYLINNTFLELAGTTPGDWFPIAVGQYGYPDDYAAYLAVIAEVVQSRYKEPGKLSPTKTTEWHRISLAILAMGGDPTCIGQDDSGNPINLIADGTYDRGKTVSLGRQGINGWIWGLIALDSMRYTIPEGAYYSRDDIITEILRKQLKDGGFALTGNLSDPDISAMAIQALAPYYESDKTYTYTQGVKGETVTRTVGHVVDEALAWLSSAQLPTGDYQSWGTENVESTAQVTVALCSLGIDPQKDERFVKDGVSLLDGMMAYRMADGGFIHSHSSDPDNPSSGPDKSNGMASEQTLYALVAVWRHMKGQGSLYDFRSESHETPTGLYQDPGAVPESPITPPTPPGSESPSPPSGSMAESGPVEQQPGPGEQAPLLYFAQSDREMVDALPEALGTEHYIEVVKLMAKLEQSDDFEGRDEYRLKLESAKEKILYEQSKIDSINRDVLDYLYPFEKVTLSDRDIVNSIVSRYSALSDYDKAKVMRWEDIVKTKTQVDDLWRAVYIAAFLGVSGILVTVLTVRRIRHRKVRREREMEVLSSRFGDDSG